MPLAVDLDTYAEQAEQFVGAMDREYYLHFAGHKPEFEIESIYKRHAGLFGRPVVDELRERLATAAPGDETRRARYLLELAVGGLLGNETKEEETALAEREAALEIEVAGERIPYRQSAVAQANEPDAGRRAEIERARLDVLERELNPLHRQTLERAHTLARELGWPSYREMYQDLKQIDLAALEQQTSAFLRGTAGAVPGERRAPPPGTGRLRLRRAAAVRPAALLPCSGVRRPVPLGADRRRHSSRRSRDWGSTCTPSPMCASTSRHGRARARGRSAPRCRCRTRCTS